MGKALGMIDSQWIYFKWIFHVSVSLQESKWWNCPLKWGCEKPPERNRRRWFHQDERRLLNIVWRTAEKNSWMPWARTNLCMSVSVMCFSVCKNMMNESDRKLTRGCFEMTQQQSSSEGFKCGATSWRYSPSSLWWTLHMFYHSTSAISWFRTILW